MALDPRIFRLLLIGGAVEDFEAQFYKTKRVVRDLSEAVSAIASMMFAALGWFVVARQWEMPEWLAWVAAVAIYLGFRHHLDKRFDLDP